MTNPAALDLLRKHVALLMELSDFDSCLIVVTRRDPDGTRALQATAGNSYATYGAVCDWLLQEDALAYNRAADALPDDPAEEME